MNENICITKNKMKKNISKKLEWDFNVPDNKSDILKICSLNVTGEIIDSEIKDDAVSLKVKLNANMLYIPDVAPDCDVKLASLESSEIFVIKGDIPLKMAYDFSDLCLFVRNATPELINSRKAGVRANVTVAVTLIKNQDLEIKIPEDIKVETKTKNICAIHIPVQLSERIAFSHSFSIPGGKPDIREILRCYADIKNKEVKAVTGKAVFKGNLGIKIIYASNKNTIECFEITLPFTEIADAKGLTDDMEMMLLASSEDLCIKVYANDENKERNLDATGYMRFNLSAFKRNNAQIVCDAFCPQFKDECIYEEINYSDISRAIKDTHTHKETVTLLDSDVLEICDITAKVHNKEAVLENGKVNITSDIVYDILYKSSNGIKCERKVSSFDFMQDAPDGRKYEAVEICSEITNLSYMITSSNSVEIRTNILFESRLLKEEKINAVSEIKADKNEKCSLNRAPIVTYFPQGREELFDIAKKYRTTVSSLKELNSLSDDFVKEGEFIIIE